MNLCRRLVQAHSNNKKRVPKGMRFFIFRSPQYFSEKGLLLYHVQRIFSQYFIILKTIKMVLEQSKSAQHTLNPVQLMLLKLFNRTMSDSEITEIRDVLLNHLEAKLHKQLEIDMANKNITQEDLRAVLNNSQRTKQ